MAITKTSVNPVSVSPTVAMASAPRAEYLFSLYKSGLEGLDKADMKDRINRLSLRELKILRNMVYASKGYKFQDYDILSFFQGYQWYNPAEVASQDAITLAQAEQDLVSYIQSIEGRGAY